MVCNYFSPVPPAPTRLLHFNLLYPVSTAIQHFPTQQLQGPMGRVDPHMCPAHQSAADDWCQIYLLHPGLPAVKTSKILIAFHSPIIPLPMCVCVCAGMFVYLVACLFAFSVSVCLCVLYRPSPISKVQLIFVCIVE